MKNGAASSLLLGIAILSSAHGRAAVNVWTSSGPSGAHVLSLAAVPGQPAVLYAGLADNGTFKSTDGASFWQRLPSQTMNASAIAVDPTTPNTVWVAHGAFALSRSVDGGQTFTTILQAPALDVVLDPARPSTIYVGMLTGRVAVSSDGGGTWKETATGLSAITKVAVVAGPVPALLAGGPPVLSGGPVLFVSRDGGSSWTAATGLGLSRVEGIAVVPDDPSIVYATGAGGLFQSTDSGSRWDRVESYSPVTGTDVLVSRGQPARVYVASGEAVYESSPNGFLRIPAPDSPQTMRTTRLALTSDEPGTLYAGSVTGVFRRRPGSSFTVVSAGMDVAEVRALAFDGPSGRLFAAAGTLGIHSSDNHGESWSPRNGGLVASGVGVRPVALHPQSPSTLYTVVFNSDGVHKSTNSGESWRLVTNGFPSSPPPFVRTVALDASMPSVLYAGLGIGGVYRSTDAGESWHAANQGLPSEAFSGLFVDPRNGTVYASTIGSGSYRSTNRGGSWTRMGLEFAGFAIDPGIGSRLYGLAGSPLSGGPAFVSNDAGLTFIIMPTAPQVSALVVDPQSSSTLYTGGVVAGIARSTNAGVSWQPFSTGLSGAAVPALLIEPSGRRLHAATTSGVYDIEIGDNPEPRVSRLSPSGILAGSAGFPITIEGSGFVGGTVVRWNGSARPTTFRSPSRVEAAITSVDVAALGTAMVSVVSPAPGGGTSTPLPFAIAVHPRPSVVLASPDAVASEGPGFTLTVVGTGFVTASVVTWNDSARPTTFVSDHELRAAIPPADIARRGAAYVRVSNPLPGGGASSPAFVGIGTGNSDSLFVPIVIDAAGAAGAFYRSELTVANHGDGDAVITWDYTAAFGEGSGSGWDVLPAGRQRVLGDSLSYLASRGVPLPGAGNRAGTLRARLRGLGAPRDGIVSVRTSTPVPLEAPTGRAGLSYSGLPPGRLLSSSATLCALRTDERDRTNIAVQNAGGEEAGDVTLGLAFRAGDGSSAQASLERTLSPGAFVQIPLGDIVPTSTNGCVLVSRLSGSAPWYAYAVINDQTTSDGSFVEPLAGGAHTDATRLILPAVVETGTFVTEVTLANAGAAGKTLRLIYVADALQSAGGAAHMELRLEAGEQRILPSFVDELRRLAVPGVGAAGPTFAGALFIEAVGGGNLDGVFAGARTSTAGGGGRYGVFYPSVPGGASLAWIHGLRQDGENRTNLAFVNTADIDDQPITLRIEIFDGGTGAKVATVEGEATTVGSRGFRQIGAFLFTHAPGTRDAYVRISRVSGRNSFLAYAIVNDGASPGERSGDGAFLGMDVEAP